MQVILTGATSFLGKWTIQELNKRGETVFAFRHGVEEERLSDHLDTKDTVLIHFGWAGAGSEGRQNEEIQAFNIAQSLETYRLAAKIGCRRFIFAGSQAEYQGVSAYGRAKKKFGDEAAALEREFQKENRFAPEFLHLRIFSVYGPRDHDTSLISSVIRARSEGKDLALGPCTQQWNYLYAGDFSVILAELVQRKEKTEGILDIGSTDTRPLKDYVSEAWSCAGEYFGSDKGEMKFGSRGNNAEGAANLLPTIDRLLELCPEAMKNRTGFSEGIRKICEASEGSR